MRRVSKFLLRLILALALLLAAALGALSWWLSGDGPRLKLQEAASAQLGAPVVVDKLSLSVWPWPSVALEGLQVQTPAPLRAQRLELRPAWGSLLGEPRQWELAALHLYGVHLPQQGLDQIRQLLLKKERFAQSPQGRTAQKAPKAPPAPASAEASSVLGLLSVPQRITLQQFTWQSAAGESLAVSGEITLSAARDAAELDLTLADGRVRGDLNWTALQTSGPMKLRGQLSAKDLDVARLPGLRTRLSGRLNATTSLQAQAPQWAGLGAALQTQTPFSVSGAVVKGLDLAKAVRTLGLSRGGETALTQLSGSVNTRGLGPALQMSLTELQASSNLLKASGAVTVGAAASAGGPRPLSGRISVDLNAPDGGTGAGKALGALIGIPLEISGTTASPQVQPTKGAMIGGAIGSVVAPVIGTGAGAKMGDQVGKSLAGLKERLFGK